LSNIYDIRNHCTNILPGHGTVTTMKEIFHSLADGQEGSETPLAYGEGDYLAALEAEEIAAACRNLIGSRSKPICRMFTFYQI